MTKPASDNTVQIIKLNNPISNDTEALRSAYRVPAAQPPTTLADEVAKLDPRLKRRLAEEKIALMAAQNDDERLQVYRAHWRSLARDCAEALCLVITSSAAFLERRDTMAHRVTRLNIAANEQIAIVHMTNAEYGLASAEIDAEAAAVIWRTMHEEFNRLMKATAATCILARG